MRSVFNQPMQNGPTLGQRNALTRARELMDSANVPLVAACLMFRHEALTLARHHYRDALGLDTATMYRIAERAS